MYLSLYLHHFLPFCFLSFFLLILLLFSSSLSFTSFVVLSKLLLLLFPFSIRFLLLPLFFHPLLSLLSPFLPYSPLLLPLNETKMPTSTAGTRILNLPFVTGHIIAWSLWRWLLSAMIFWQGKPGAICKLPLAFHQTCFSATTTTRYRALKT